MSADDDPHETELSGAGDAHGASAMTAIVLAAGRGLRMGSGTPKVLQPLAGRPLVGHVLHALQESGVGRAVVVVPPAERGEEIRSGIASHAPAGLELGFAEQLEATGTADAVRAARSLVESEDVLVINGDLGLLTADQLAPLVAASGASASLLVARVAEPAAMGRIVRAEDGRVLGIVEARDATAEQLAIDEVNVGVYRFDAGWLWAALERAACGGGERYATDVIAEAAAQGRLAAVEVGAAGRSAER